jgi:hypothetical protein
MKRALFFVVAVLVVAGLIGCAHDKQYCGPNCMNGSCAGAPETCGRCGPGMACGGCGAFAGCCGGGGVEPTSPGPPTGQVTYPYYTVRGPRDFLARSPRPIGP